MAVTAALAGKWKIATRTGVETRVKRARGGTPKPAPIAPERKPLDPPGARRGVPMQMPTEPTIDSLRDVEFDPHTGPFKQ